MLILLATLAQAGETLAVLDFQAHTDDAERGQYGRGIADMLMTDLKRGEGVQIVERARLNDVLDELSLNQSEYVDAENAVEIGKLLGADRVVVGGLNFSGDSMRADARVVNVASSEAEHAVQVEGRTTDLFAVERQLALALLRELDVPLDERDLTYFHGGEAAVIGVRIDDATTTDAIGAMTGDAFGEAVLNAEPYAPEPPDPRVKKGGKWLLVGSGIVVGTWTARRFMNPTSPAVYRTTQGVNAAGWVAMGIGTTLVIQGSF